jgi:hypothetical protein
MWIEQGSPYDVAVGQCRYYSPPKNSLDEVVIPITIATRFARTGKVMPIDFIEHLKTVIDKYEQLQLADFELTEEEIPVLKEEVEEVSGYIS